MANAKSRAAVVWDRKLKNVNEKGNMYTNIHFADLVLLSNRSVYFTYSLLLHQCLKIKSCWTEIKKLGQVKVIFDQKILPYILVNQIWWVILSTDLFQECLMYFQLLSLTWGSLVHDLFVFEIPKDVDYNIIYTFNIIS